jgi:hypothetical protein
MAEVHLAAGELSEAEVAAEDDAGEVEGPARESRGPSNG